MSKVLDTRALDKFSAGVELAGADLKCDSLDIAPAISITLDRFAFQMSIIFLLPIL